MLEGQIIGTVNDTPQAHPGSAGVSFTVGVGDGQFELTVTHALAHTARLLKAGTTVLIDLAAQDGRLEVRHIEILGTAAPRNSFRVSGAMIWADSPAEGVTLTVPGLGEVLLIATDLSALGFTGGVYDVTPIGRPTPNETRSSPGRGHEAQAVQRKRDP